jgi:Cd2+/Zn2+-exporting ATPase
MEKHYKEDKANEECVLCNIETSYSTWKDKRIILITIFSIILLLGLFFKFIMRWDLFSEILFMIITIALGSSVAKEGFYSLIFQRKLSIEFLIMLAAIGSFFIDHKEEGATIILLFYVAEFLEVQASERAKKSIASLMKLIPEVATVKRNGKEITVHVHDVKANEIIIVKPWEKIPLDGKIVSGISSVNQAPITGESIPVIKQVGDEVYAGTINNEGFLEIKVIKPSNETMLSKIVKLIEEARKTKSATEKFIDKFSKYYTPFVIFLAISVATIPTFVFSLPFKDWFYKALILLVVSCPCALTISTPVAMVSAITNAAKNGILIKGSIYVEAISKVNVFAFDKTGTLTEGKLEVTDIIPLKDSENGILLKAASLEALSEHPIAKAIVEKAKEKEIELKRIDEFKSITGKGVIGKIDNELYCLGNRKLFEELSIPFPNELVEKLETEGKTVMIVGNGYEVIGLIAVMDKIREKVIKAIAELKKNGIKSVMITGDNKIVAKMVANKMGIEEYSAELSPEDKVNVIRKLSESYGKIAVVGDGVNDAPALASANVGIAMGAIGNDISLENADIVLMQDDLSKLPYLIKLSKKTIEIVKENILSSILIKGSLIILAFSGFITLWFAVAIGDMGLSLAVILNAMRLSLMKSGF